MEFIIVSSVKQYRDLARTRIMPSDHVLEVGCSFGETTQILAEKSGHIVSIDNAIEMIKQTRNILGNSANVKLVHSDARDFSDIKDLIPDPDAIFIDIGGNQQLDKIATVLRSCLKAFTPPLLVVRNIELAALGTMVNKFEPTDTSCLMPSSANDEGHREKRAITQFMEMSHSYLISNRTFAIRKLKQYIEHTEVLKRIEEMKSDDSPTVRRIARGIIINYLKALD